jgi:hypothetical protein
MNYMTKTPSRSLIIAILLAIAAIFLIFSLRSRNNLKINTFEIENGYGYSITIREKIFIYQPFIPAVEGNIPFSSRSDARKTARIVKRKLKNNEEAAVSVKELREAGIKL